MTAGGGSWILQLLQTTSQLIMAMCSLFYLHREKVFAARKAKLIQGQVQHAKATVKHQARPEKQREFMVEQKAAEIKQCA